MTRVLVGADETEFARKVHAEGGDPEAERVRHGETWFGGFQALKGISTTVRRGEVVVIVGPSGSGKSTFIRTLNRLERHDVGRIVVDGIELTDDIKNIERIRSEIGMVFQSFNLFPHLTVMDNVTLAPRNARRWPRSKAERKAEQLLDRVGIPEQARKYPAQLSGGQQQRVAIARSLAMSPQLMLFDEITSALDPELVGEVLKVLEEMARDGMSMMLVTHEMGFARRVASRVVFMHQAKVWEQGPAAETLARPRTPELETFLSAVLH